MRLPLLSHVPQWGFMQTLGGLRPNEETSGNKGMGLRLHAWEECTIF
ncbi:MAG: hypothetical protein II658_09255 [Prevotella sp.]|nr:hypothetical protein [Prevotella sp.]MBQ1700751.1 hypothetical protein [Prevotella sp.]MBQ4211177.1 hypothetical protein [Prevotella sp.]